jgi:DNA-binding FadR family transcriptional regulator
MTAKESGTTSPKEPGTPSARAADEVIATLEAKIMSGALRIDTPLPTERELKKQFNTSRTVIREAIAALSNRGLVENRPRFRPIVKKPDYTAALNAVGGVVGHLMSQPSGVKNLYESRVFFERALVREAAAAARREDIRQLRAALAANEQATGDSDRFYATDVAFHGVLYRIPRNPIFPAIHEAYTTWLSPHCTCVSRLTEFVSMNVDHFGADAAPSPIRGRDREGFGNGGAARKKHGWSVLAIAYLGAIVTHRVEAPANAYPCPVGERRNRHD